MKISTIMTVALAAVFLAGATDVHAATEERKEERSKIRLKDENRILRDKIDSLQAELDRYRSELAYTDSITTEMLDITQRMEDAEDRL